MIGAAYHFAFGLSVDLRYGMGLTNVWKSKYKYDIRHTMLVIGVAYSFSQLFMPHAR